MVNKKTEIMKNSIIILAIMAFLLIPYSCNKEDPAPTSATFTTNLQNNTVASGEMVTIYLKDARGEFLTYFAGTDSSNTYGTGSGTPLELGTDSLLLYYYNAGTFTFSLAAISYGDWGETVSKDVQSVDINVIVEE